MIFAGPFHSIINTTCLVNILITSMLRNQLLHLLNVHVYSMWLLLIGKFLLSLLLIFTKENMMIALKHIMKKKLIEWFVKIFFVSYRLHLYKHITTKLLNLGNMHKCSCHYAQWVKKDSIYEYLCIIIQNAFALCY